LLGFAISLASSFSWGISDFLGGQTSRRMPVLVVLAISQPVGLLLIGLMIVLFGADPIPADKLAIAALAGAASLGGLWAFYAAMAMGTVSVVAPIASLGVMVPVVVGLAKGDSPATIQLIGLAPAIAGVVILGYEERPEHAAVTRRSILLAILAGLGFGIFFTALDLAATDRPGWAVLAVRVGGVTTVAIALLISRPRLSVVSGSIAVLIAIGVFDVLANALFAVASTKGVLPVVAVGGSMYPAFTIALAYVVLGERLARIQWAGVGLALLGVVLIAAGT
jgi:drug/metabolite transporter (DMT)-like permease